MVKDVLKNFAKFIRLCMSPVFCYSCWLSDCNFIEKRIQYRRFPMNIARKLWKFPRTSLLQKTTGQLLLDGNDPGESLIFWGKPLRNASFLTRGRLYFNSSYIFAKNSTNFSLLHTIRLLFGGISHISKIMPCRTCRRWNKCFQDFQYSIHTECSLTRKTL